MPVILPQIAGNLCFAIIILMGFIPASAPHQICQVIINFICAMQYNTFRSAEGVAMATTFCTNHIRQIGILLAGLFDPGKNNRALLRRTRIHVVMVIFFVVGVALSAVACRYLGTYAIWLNLIPLTVLFVDLLHADLTKEKDMLDYLAQTVKKNEENTEKTVSSACAYLEKNLEFARMIFNNNVDPDFARKLFALESVKASTLKKYYDSKNETELEYIYNFLTYGIFRLIHVWLNKEMRESPEEFARMVMRLLMKD